MSLAPFVHLRLHSGYSLLEGATRFEDLFGICRQLRMPAVALTDTANLFGALEFSAAAAKAGIQPIVGALLPLAGDEESKTGNGKPEAPDRLPLLVQDATGYANLIHLLSRAYLTGEPGQTVQVALDALEGRTDGLIALSGGPEGPVGRLLLKGRRGPAEAMMRRLAELFPDRLYVELMRHGLEAEERIEAALLDMAYGDLNLPVVATNDVHFLEAGMHEAHEALLCIADGAQLAQTDRRRLSAEFRLKSAEEMAELFADLPEAIANTLVIARRCAFKVPTSAPILPAFPTVGGRSEAEEMRAQARAGLDERLKLHVYAEGDTPEQREAKRTTYHERLEYELGIIEQMQFPGYFLIVADFIQWAKNQDIPVGPGRGSGAGSVVAWSLKITDLDPLRFGLLFERFLNPERVSMPDFDIDFCQDGRDRVIRYVQDKYGTDRVAAIITFGKLQARAALRDVGRVLGLPYFQVDRISKLVPFNPANPPTLAQAMQLEPRLAEAKRDDEQVGRMVDIAMKLEGLPRHASTHAAGIVIGDRPLDEMVPLYRDPRSPMPVTQFNMKDVEKAGLVKFDFLGLTTLTLLRNAERLVNQRGIPLDLATLPLDDAKAYGLLARGDTAGVFQLESGGMRDALRKLKPDRFEDIIAMVSLYRPGPMDNIPRYINVKQGVEEAEYLHPLLRPILAETHGVIIYQEQVMQIAQDLAGYTLGGADLLRRAMGKKIKAEMDAQREVFVEGAVERKVGRELASTIFDAVAKFASYGFNKSHAAAYALLAYHTAYMKANHAVEFFASSMTIERESRDKLTLFRSELVRAGITLLPPDVNRSMAGFAVEDTEQGPAIRYALSAIRGVGTAAMEALVAEREQGGPFTDIFDLTARLGARQLNKRLLEGLIKAGAFDTLHDSRNQLVQSLDHALRFAAAKAEIAASSQDSLFGGGMELEVPKPPLAQAEEWPMMERLGFEFDALGCYLSAHPLDGYRAALERLGVVGAADLVSHVAIGGMPFVKLAGVVLAKQERATERSRFAFVQLSDASGVYEITVFSELLGSRRELLESGRPLLVSGEARVEGDAVKILASNIQALDELASSERERPVIEIRLGAADVIDRLGAILAEGSGGARVRLIVPVDGEGLATIALPERYGLPFQRRFDVERAPGVLEVREL
ncbi:DNA polymerase III subunit alpha [Marinivivus vitaminiproducens]|uniref:DNA polymerase III subunit alpha n=1 Tax=Marinivivus vitaminiproducens TaxID=3035935 RepID=UPI0027A9FA39|nr:DNA polymerase III subunit alpha [Geminicoccaceae bacterium SCSIO 64248]